MLSRMRHLRRDWTIRAFKNSSLISSRVLTNRTQNEAAKSASAQVERMGGVDEYTLTPVVRRQPSILAAFLLTF